MVLADDAWMGILRARRFECCILHSNVPRRNGFCPNVLQIAFSVANLLLETAHENNCSLSRIPHSPISYIVLTIKDDVSLDPSGNVVVGRLHLEGQRKAKAVKKEKLHAMSKARLRKNLKLKDHCRCITVWKLQKETHYCKNLPGWWDVRLLRCGHCYSVSEAIALQWKCMSQFFMP